MPVTALKILFLSWIRLIIQALFSTAVSTAFNARVKSIAVTTPVRSAIFRAAFSVLRMAGSAIPIALSLARSISFGALAALFFACSAASFALPFASAALTDWLLIFAVRFLMFWLLAIRSPVIAMFCSR